MCGITGSRTGALPFAMADWESEAAGGRGGGGSLREVESGVVSERDLPAWMRRMRWVERLGGR